MDNLKKNKRVFLVGDSTVCNYDKETSVALDRQGWGMRLGDYFSEDLEIINLALSGRSSRSFLMEDYYKVLIGELSEGDYLFIQFGHNDEKVHDPNRGTYPNLNMACLDDEGKNEKGEYSFEWMLFHKYIKLAWERGASPILITPITRRMESGEANITGHIHYTAAIKTLASKYDIPCIDLMTQTKELYNAVYTKEGGAATAAFHAWNDKEKEKIDNTHLSRKGATTIAELVADNIKILDESLSDWLIK